MVVTSLCALVTAEAFAEGLVRLDPQRVRYVSEEEVTEPSPSDVVPAPPAADSSMKPVCGWARWQCGDSPAPWALFAQTDRGIKVGGWVQMGYFTEGANGVGTAGPTGHSFNNYPNVVQLQQAWIYAEKVADTGGCGWDWGFRIDYVYGTDGQDTQAFGNVPGIWDEPWDNGGHYGSALPQLYAEIAYNDWSVKAGHFYTIIGYEVVPAVNNFFYSHSMTIQYEPYTHTGLLAQYAWSDRVTLYGGWVAGYDTGFDQNGGDMFLGGLSIQLTDALSLTYATAIGDFGFATGTGSDSNGYAHSIVLDWDLTCRWNYVLQSDYVDNTLAFAAGPVFTVNQYLFYTLNDRWAAGGRFEWLHLAGTDEEFTAVTIGANYRPHPNLVFRPEIRVDVLSERPALQDSTVFGIDAVVTF